MITTETTLDFDHSVGTEDRFVIRRMLDRFAESANNTDTQTLNNMIAPGTMIEGFADLPYSKEEFISVVSRWQHGGRVHTMRFPKLKLSFNQYLYHLKGTYEEFVDQVLGTEGSIEMDLVKRNEAGPEAGTAEPFQIVKIVFYPRMRLSEE